MLRWAPRHRAGGPGLTACPGGSTPQRARAACAADTEAQGTGHPEPPTADFRLLGVVLSPHVPGGILVRLAPAAVQNAVDHLDGEPLRDYVS
ncbi:hypothetical protein ACIA8E_27690 [Streptomyces sp. NPDC051664]|uniref:hypothetical protein n=1 Tax=Streptomyces sp. NPDC051664 TaxID=3365668 RepID=UPI0037BD7957